LGLFRVLKNQNKPMFLKATSTALQDSRPAARLLLQPVAGCELTNHHTNDHTNEQTNQQTSTTDRNTS